MLNKIPASIMPPGVSTPEPEVTTTNGATPVQKGEKTQSAEQAETITKPDPEELAKATATVSEFVQVVRRNLEFSVDEDTGMQVVTVTDAETGELVRQIPSQEILNIARHIASRDNNGVLISTKS
jgi:flagellar protein FlaG